MQRGRSDEKFWLSVVVGTLHLSIIADAETLRLSLVRYGEEEAPRLRLGSRSSAPRPVAMNGLLADPMTSANDSTENAARYSDSSSRDSIDNSDESISRRAVRATTLNI
ncbi:MAG: hypothetical protein EPO55_00440 [Reyranella sp.]|uniref:hypothetical protein n=1 Tax=Reyranella sp. TaxID=1929291 RepID=UPI0012079DB6|nr:hypothetical protein [Reyranella sp.]TAJ42884.1 MAG: hypothetical protein EPO55_00440 [Reyranella sp.]